MKLAGKLRLPGGREQGCDHGSGLKGIHDGVLYALRRQRIDAGRGLTDAHQAGCGLGDCRASRGIADVYRPD
jgi:hypothetical protein